MPRPARLAARGLEKRHLPTCQGTSATPTGPMAQYEYMAGHWEGLGWSVGQDGKRSTYVQTEDIHFTDPTHLDVRGTGHDPKNLKRIVFSAHAIASPRADGSIQWLALSDGNTLDTTLLALPDGWTWDVPFGPGAFVRYETRYTHGDRAWHETGKFTMDGGKTWQTIQQMTLVKTCDL